MRWTLISFLVIVAISNAAGQKQKFENIMESQSPVNIALEEVNKSFTPPPQQINQLKSGGIKTCNIEVEYVDFPSSAKTAFEYAISIWETLIASPITINVQAKWETLKDNAVACSRSAINYINFEGAPVADVYYPISLVEKLTAKDYNNQGEPDIICSFSSGTPWYFGTDGNTPTTKYDFVSAVMHEVTHGLGFSGYLKVENGVGFFDNPNHKPGIFDYYIYNKNLQKIADNTVFQSPSAELLRQLTSQSLNFNGSQICENAEDGTNIYAPATWREGASIYHLNESDFNAGDKNALMTAYTYKGEAIHNPGEATEKILADLGWKSISFIFCELKDIEETCENLPVQIKLHSELPIDSSSVKLVYLNNYFSTADSVSLQFNAVKNLFEGNFPLQYHLGKLQYYFEVHTADNKSFTIPSKAPAVLFNFRIGPDYYPPKVKHNPIKVVSNYSKEIEFTAYAEDNIGINTVKIEYQIDGIVHDPILLESNSEDCFVGKLQMPKNLSETSRIEYRIVAQDKAKNGNKKTLPATNYYSVNVFEPENAISNFFSDFDSPYNDFLFSDFEISTPFGFQNGVLHTHHPYHTSSIENEEYNLFAQLKYPIIVEENGVFSYEEVVLVEPGEAESNYKSMFFWDYVIVEASKDNGITWQAIIDGYDSGIEEDWHSEFTKSLSNNTAKAEANDKMLVRRTINLTDNTGLFAGDTVVFRFRLSSDKSVNGWGWAIENLNIQSGLTSMDEDNFAENTISVYPNPCTNNINIDCSKMTDIKSDIDIMVTDVYGKTVYRKTWFNAQFEQRKQLDLSNVEPGMYLVNLSSEKKSNIVSQQIIKN